MVNKGIKGARVFECVQEKETLELVSHCLNHCRCTSISEVYQSIEVLLILMGMKRSNQKWVASKSSLNLNMFNK